MQQVSFNDIEGLKALISEEFGPWSPSIVVDQQKIDAFADLTGDHQWIHVDVERAKNSPFKTTIAHGFLVLSLLSSMRAPRDFEIINHKSVVNFGSGGLRFLAPVPSGCSIHSHDRLASIDEHKKGTLVTYEFAIHVVGSDKPSLTYNMQMLYMG